MCFKNIPFIAIVLVLIVIDVNIARKPNILIDTPVEKRDYTPSKWIANSAMDVWYGNKSMVDIISRELSELMNRIVDKRVRRSVSNVTDNPFIPKIDMPERIHFKEFEDRLNTFFEARRRGYSQEDSRKSEDYYPNQSKK